MAVEVSPGSSRPLVHVIALGGTIAMTDDAGHGIVPRLTAQDLVAAVPGIAEVAEISSEQLRQVPSSALTLSDLLAVARRAQEALAAGATGVVVTQGTDTIEESAFALDLLLDVAAPVVVTGAMRPPEAAGPDGAANLAAAVRTAVASEARGAGVLVVLDEQIHAAATVRKIRTFGAGAFASPDSGPLGWVVEGNVHLVARPAHRTSLASSATDPATIDPATIEPDVLARTAVGVVPVHLGDDARAVAAVAGQGYAGVVVDGLGAGHVPPSLVAPLASLAAEIPVVLASRTGSGRVHTSTYGYPGSETELIAAGLVPAGGLDSRKAKVLLTLLLVAGVPREEIPRWFDAPSAR